MPVAPPSAPILDPPDPEKNERDLEILRGISTFIRDQIIQGHGGKIPPAQTIAARLIVLHTLLYPGQYTSLADIARQLGCSRAWLSKLAKAFSANLGMRATWQRIASREIYSQRAKGVHAGTWVPTAEHERKKLRQTRNARAVSKNGERLRTDRNPSP